MRTILTTNEATLIVNKSRFSALAFHIQDIIPKPSTIVMLMSLVEKKRVLMMANQREQLVVPSLIY